MKQLFENELYTKPYVNIGREKPFPLHYHRHLEILYVLSGQMSVQIGSQSETISKGQLLFASPYVVHGYMESKRLQENEEFLCVKILLEPECVGLLGNYLLEYRPKTHIISANQIEKAFNGSAARLVKLAESFASQETNCIVSGYEELFCLLHSIFALTRLEKYNKHKETVCSKAIRCCCDNYLNEDFNTDSLTERLFVSRSYLQKLFKRNLNLGIMEYVTLLRISKAETYLRESSLTISDICFRCGYGTVRSFNRAFMRIHNQTPSQYRESQKQIANITGIRILSNFDLFYGGNQ